MGGVLFVLVCACVCVRFDVCVWMLLVIYCVMLCGLFVVLRYVSRVGACFVTIVLCV